MTPPLHLLHEQTWSQRPLAVMMARCTMFHAVTRTSDGMHTLRSMGVEGSSSSWILSVAPHNTTTHFKWEALFCLQWRSVTHAFTPT